MGARRFRLRPRSEAPHKKAFDAYLRNGDDDGLRGLTLEGKALNTAVAADGGYLVDPQTADTHPVDAAVDLVRSGRSRMWCNVDATSL